MRFCAASTWVKVVVERDSPDSNVCVRLRGLLLGLTLNF
jgi:hypothetical protein